MILNKIATNKIEVLKTNKEISEILIKISVPLNSLINLLDISIVFLFVKFGLGKKLFLEVWRYFCIANN